MLWLSWPHGRRRRDSRNRQVRKPGGRHNSAGCVELTVDANRGLFDQECRFRETTGYEVAADHPGVRRAQLADADGDTSDGTGE
ncbi:hypothetical protein, partial [Kitasatospora sp. NPDC093558]|uniref:hypothetical protein n=1 Tax=Kitasatospora sp. NPDC093558 TaxID=3155201 RepID=UPI00341852DF